MRLISSRTSQWMKALLVVAGIYSVSWGLSVIFFPGFWFRIADLELPRYVQLWQSIGMMTAVMGIGYLIASTNPMRHWPVVLVGLLMKIFAPLGFLYYYLSNDLPLVILHMHITNDMIWWLPFGLILYNVYMHDYLLDREIIQLTEHDTRELLSWHQSNKGNVLLDLSYQQPIMLVFLRHFGCTFCREMLEDVAKNRAMIEDKGVKIVLIHQMEYPQAKRELCRFGLNELENVSDPELILYKGFQLKRGTLSQLFGIKDLLSLFRRGTLIRLGVSGHRAQDPFQMPGIFVIRNGLIVKQFVHRSVSEKVPYSDLITIDRIHIN